MKTIKQLMFIGMVIALVLSSCSIQKRVYLSGYHIEWNKLKHNLDKQQLVSNNNIKDKELSKTVTVEKSENKINQVDNKTTKIEESITASVDNKQIILPKREKLIFCLSPQAKKTNDKTNISIKSKFKKGLRILSEGKLAEETKTNGLAVTSLVLGILALITYYGAFLFGILAIIFGATALKKIKTNPEKYYGKGMAKAGLICGIVALSLIIIIVALAALFISSLLI